MAAKRNETSMENDVGVNRINSSRKERALEFLPKIFTKRLVYSHFLSAHVLLSGNTLDAHTTFMNQLNVKMNQCSVESCSVVLLFCPVTSRMGTDMEEAMKKAPENKPVVLVVMHHHHDPNLVLSPPVQLPKDNIVKVVQCIFHESQGLLKCERNVKAIKEVSSALKSTSERALCSTERN